MALYLGSWITKNWVLKLFSLLLAFLLWATIASDISSEITRTVDLEFQSIPTGMEITQKSTNEVQVTLQGPSSVLNGMSDADIRAFISLAGQSPGPLTAEPVIRPPEGVVVHTFDPLTVQFTLENTVRRTLPVRANVEGTPAEGYLLGSIFVDPPALEVIGPASSIEPLEALTTSAVRIDGRRTDLREFATLSVLDPLIRLPSAGRRPEVFVQIEEEQTEATYQISFDPSMRASEWSLDTETVSATISGPRSRMAELDPEGLYFTFDPADLEADTGQVIPRVVGIDRSLSVVNVDPGIIRVASARQ